MDPNLDARLSAIEKKLEENNRLLTHIRRVQRNANLMRIGYIIVIIFIGFGSWYFIKPYLGQLGDAYGMLGGSGEKTGGSSYSELFEQLKAFQAGQE